MSKDKAWGDIYHIKMEWGDLDKYILGFKHLICMGDYNIDEEMVCDWFFQGLPVGLQGSMIQFKETDWFTHFNDWVEGIIRQHKKYQRWQNIFSSWRNQPQKPFGQSQKPMHQQWQQKFVKDWNAMDLTPGCTCARAALSKGEQATLHK